MGEQELVHLPRQEPEVILESPPEDYSSAVDPPDFSVLRLHSSPPSTLSRHRRHSPCSSCGCSGHSHSHSRKRPAIPNPTNHHHPNPAKKLFLDTSTPESHPHGVSAEPHFPIRRTVSDSSPFSGSGISSNTSPANPNPPGSASKSSSLPPLPPATTLRRSVSDPIPSPSLPPPDNSTPSSKRSKMLSSWREFNRWIEKEFIGVEQQAQDCQTQQVPSVITIPSTTTNKEDNDDDFVCTDNEDNDNAFVIANKNDSVTEFEESLSVERDGERLNIHFKCHCGNAYQFLLADGNCYYKLM